MNFRITPDDLALFTRPVEDFFLSLEFVHDCDGVPCAAPDAPHGTPEPHWHIRLTLPGVLGARYFWFEGLPH
jgi:hypothetical protein